MAGATETLYDAVDSLFDHMRGTTKFGSTGVLNDPTPYEIPGTGIVEPAGWVQNASSTDGTATVIIDADGITILGGALQVSDSVGNVLIQNGVVQADGIEASSITADKLAVGSNSMFTNPNFETGDLKGWSSHPASSGGQVAIDGPNTSAYAGVYSVTLHNGTVAGTYIESTSYVPVAVGEKQTLSVWLNGSGISVSVALTYYNKDRAYIGSASTSPTLGSGWQEVTLQGQAPSGAAYVNVKIANTSVPPGGSTLRADAIRFSSGDVVANSTGEVLIDSSGITIVNGALTLQDAFGNNVITGGGFGTSWLAFLDAGGVYNADFSVGTNGSAITGTTIVGTASTVADYEASLSADIPYWIISRLTGTTKSLLRTTNANFPSGYVLQALGDTDWEIFQDIPVTPGQFYEVLLNWSYGNSGGSSFASDINIDFRNSTHAQVGTGGAGGGLSYSGSHSTPFTQSVISSGLVPGAVRYIRVYLRHYRTGGTSPWPSVYFGKIMVQALVRYSTMSIMGYAANLDLFTTPYDGASSLYPNLRLNSSGTIEWGAGGTSASDVSLQRSSSGFLTLTGTFLHSTGDWHDATMQNSWVTFDSSRFTPGYIRDAFGNVRLRGLIKSGTLGAAAFTLPSGYRPSKIIILSTISNGAIGRLDIGTDGAVRPSSPSSNAWVSLDGLCFSLNV